MSPDDIVTLVTEAPDSSAALAILAGIPARTLQETADLLHIDPDGHGLPWLRRAIVAEARA